MPTEGAQGPLREGQALQSSWLDGVVSEKPLPRAVPGMEERVAALPPPPGTTPMAGVRTGEVGWGWRLGKTGCQVDSLP